MRPMFTLNLHCIKSLIKNLPCLLAGDRNADDLGQDSNSGSETFVNNLYVSVVFAAEKRTYAVYSGLSVVD